MSAASSRRFSVPGSSKRWCIRKWHPSNAHSGATKSTSGCVRSVAGLENSAGSTPAGRLRHRHGGCSSSRRAGGRPPASRRHHQRCAGHARFSITASRLPPMSLRARLRTWLPALPWSAMRSALNPRVWRRCRERSPDRRTGLFRPHHPPGPASVSQTSSQLNIEGTSFGHSVKSMEDGLLHTLRASIGELAGLHTDLQRSIDHMTATVSDQLKTTGEHFYRTAGRHEQQCHLPPEVDDHRGGPAA